MIVVPSSALDSMNLGAIGGYANSTADIGTGDGYARCCSLE